MARKYTEHLFPITGMRENASEAFACEIFSAVKYLEWPERASLSVVERRVKEKKATNVFAKVSRVLRDQFHGGKEKKAHIYTQREGKCI